MTGRGGLQQVPPVPVRIDEHHDGPVGLLAWHLEETNPASGHLSVVALEVFGHEEQGRPATRLVADALPLPAAFA